MGQGQTKESVYCYGGCYTSLCTFLSDMSIVALDLNDDDEEYDCQLFSCLTRDDGCICAPPTAYLWSGTVFCHNKMLEEIRNQENSSNSSSIRGRTPSLHSSPSHSRNSSSVRTPDLTYRPRFNSTTFFEIEKSKKRSINADEDKNSESHAYDDIEIQ